MSATSDRGWASLRTFDSLPNLDWADPNLRFVDLSGDWSADVLLADGESITWHASLAEAGFAPAELVEQ